MPPRLTNYQLNQELGRFKAKLLLRYQLSAMLLEQLKDFKEGPRSVLIPPNYSLDDVKAVRHIFERLFRTDVRFPAGGSIHMQFYLKEEK